MTDTHTQTPRAIHGQIAKVMAEMSAVPRDQRNQAQGFNYRGIDQIYNELHAQFAKHGIYTTSDIMSVAREAVALKSGGTASRVTLQARYYFHSSIDGSHVHSEVIGEGVDSGDKAASKAMALAHKYCLLQCFLIPTEDPDAETVEVRSNTPGVQNHFVPQSAPTAAATKKGFAPENAAHMAALVKACVAAGLRAEDGPAVGLDMVGRPSSEMAGIIEAYKLRWEDMKRAGEVPHSC